MTSTQSHRCGPASLWRHISIKHNRPPVEPFSSIGSGIDRDELFEQIIIEYVPERWQNKDPTKEEAMSIMQDLADRYTVVLLHSSPCPQEGRLTSIDRESSHPLVEAVRELTAIGDWPAGEIIVLSPGRDAFMEWANYCGNANMWLIRRDVWDETK